MDICRAPLPALKLPPPNIVTESPPMSPLALESSKKETHNKNLRRNISHVFLPGSSTPGSPTAAASSVSIRPNTLLTPSSPRSSPSPQRKHTLSAPGHSLTAPSTNHLTSLTPTHHKPAAVPAFRRAVSEPAGKSSRHRVNLGPGCGMLDWIRLCKNSKDMAGTNGEVLTVTEDELAKHCTMEDAWTCIRGQVYNITPYFKFHPGGKEDLLRAAGKDSTILFDEVHKWVNYKSMLKKCFVGKMSEETKRIHTADSLNVPKQLMVSDGMNRQAVPKRISESSEEASVHSPQSPVHPPIQFINETDSPGAIVVEPPSPIRKNSDASRPVVTLWDWGQTTDTVTIQVFIHNNKNISESDIIVDADGTNFEASIKLGGWIYQMAIELSHAVNSHPSVFIHSNKVDIRLCKAEPNVAWDNIGKLQPTHNQMISESNKVIKYRSCTIHSIQDVTHDTRLFTLEVPSTCHMLVPIGHHVSIKPVDPAVEVERSYTPVKPLISSATNKHNSNNANRIELLIKLYKDGCMSQHLAKLSPGDQLQVSDPQGTFEASRLSSVTDVLLVAAGTGFTPMVRVMNQLLCDANAPKVHLLFANKTMKDIVWENELKALTENQKNFSVTHILSAAEDSWEGLRGRVSRDLLNSNLPTVPKSEDEYNKVLVCVCGPLPFTSSVTDMLLDVNYPDTCLHIFQ